MLGAAFGMGAHVRVAQVAMVQASLPPLVHGLLEDEEHERYPKPSLN